MKNKLITTIVVAIVVLAGILAIMPVQTVSAASSWVKTTTVCTNDDGDPSFVWHNTRNGHDVCR